MSVISPLGVGREPVGQRVLVLAPGQGVRCKAVCWVEFVDPPQQSAHHRGAVFDEVVTAVEEQLDVAGVGAVLGSR